MRQTRRERRADNSARVAAHVAATEAARHCGPLLADAVRHAVVHVGADAAYVYARSAGMYRAGRKTGERQAEPLAGGLRWRRMS